MRENTIKLIEESKIITIVRGVASDKLIPLVQAMYDGGIRLVECTYDASGKKSDEAVAADIKMLYDTFGDKMAIGAGTVMSEKQVELTKKAYEFLAEKAYDPTYGARPLKRVINMRIENPLARAIISGEIKSGGTMKFTEKELA
jgi:hypothetical protein